MIAGTLVHTDQGLVPIEQLKVGDRVLSQPEHKGEKAYRKITNTFVYDDKPIWVIKYMLVDGDVAYDHPDYIPKDKTLYHCYATGNHPFWVEGIGWTAAEELEDDQFFELADGKRAVVCLILPVIRRPEPGFGWVPVHMQNRDHTCAHIVDFRNGSNLWKYRWNRPNEAPVPYRAGYLGEAPGEPGYGMAQIFDSGDTEFRTRVYNIEVEGFHTYYVGELGILVRDTSR